MPEKSAAHIVEISKQYPSVEIHLTISAVINTDEKYGSVGIYMDPSFLPSLSLELQDKFFFQEIGNGVHAALSDANFAIPDEGDLEVKIVDFRISPFDVHMTKEEVESLSHSLYTLVYEIVFDLLGDLKKEK